MVARQGLGGLGWAVVWMLGACPRSALATYSIAAVDKATQQVGGAVTSCVGDLDVGVVYGSVPGLGVVHAQALLDSRARAKDQALQLLMRGLAPSEIIAQITAPAFDSAYASRQYGVVDLMGRAAGYTGERAQDYKHDQQGDAEGYVYSVQGNILTSQRVLDQAAGSFEQRGCDLAERLMLALEAGAEHGEGDSRCTDGDIPSDSAFIEVDLPDEPAGTYLRLSVMGTAPRSPLVRLRAEFDDWRAAHPCPALMPDAGGPDAMPRGAGTAGAGAGVQDMAPATGVGVDAGRADAAVGGTAARAFDGGVGAMMEVGAALAGAGAFEGGPGAMEAGALGAASAGVGGASGGRSQTATEAAWAGVAGAEAAEVGARGLPPSAGEGASGVGSSGGPQQASLRAASSRSEQGAQGCACAPTNRSSLPGWPLAGVVGGAWRWRARRRASTRRRRDLRAHASADR